MNCAPYLAALATSTPRPEMTWLCGLAHAPMRESSGRLAKYSSLSASLTFSTVPSMRTTRSSSTQ